MEEEQKDETGKIYTKGYGQGKIKVEEISIDEFNNAPTKYLKTSESQWIYDVIVFGSSDKNDSKDLSDLAYNEVKKYIDAGYGVLFGHDTITIQNINFAKLSSYVKISIGGTQEYTGASKIEVTRKGYITQYPYIIDEEQISIPLTHTNSQWAAGDVWIRFPLIKNEFGDNTITDKETETGRNNFYLTTNNNTSMIQTGHTKGEASEEEKKIIANVIWYLGQTTKEMEATIRTAEDTAKPESPDGYFTKIDEETIKIELNAEDQGVFYEHFVGASRQDGKTPEVMIVVDSSWTMNHPQEGGNDIYYPVKQAASQLAGNLVEKGIKVGYVEFSGDARLYSVPIESKDIVNIINNVPYQEGGTNTPAGIRLAAESFSEKASEKIVIVFTDGDINAYGHDEEEGYVENDFSNALQVLKDRNINLISILSFTQPWYAESAMNKYGTPENPRYGKVYLISTNPEEIAKTLTEDIYISIIQMQKSNVVQTEVITGIAGYSYVIDENKDTIPDDEIDEVPEYLRKEDYIGKDKTYYMHIKAIDGAGNVGETAHIEIKVVNRISKEDLEENNKLYCIENGVIIPARDDGTENDATVETNEFKQYVESPTEGQIIGRRYEEDGEKEEGYNIYNNTYSNSIAEYEDGEKEEAEEDIAYILSFYNENTGMESESQKALYATKINGGTPGEETELSKEAKAYKEYREKIENNGGYKYSTIEQKTEVLYNENRNTFLLRTIQNRL